MNIDMQALRLAASELGLKVDDLIFTIERALLKAYRNLPGSVAKARTEIDQKTGKIVVIADEVDEYGEKIGEFDDTPAEFGRIAIATARSVITQKLREIEDDKIFGSYKDKEGQVVSGVVQQSRDPNVMVVKLGEHEGILPVSEQVPGENYEHGDWIRVFIVKIGRSDKGARIELSRRHPDLVKGLFTREVPEISSGDVMIESVAREAGYRTKIAIRATRPNINPKGACIGPLGARVRAVMNELNHEKIDIIEYSEDPTVFVANALSPAHVASVTMDDEDLMRANVVVPNFQLSLAIGKEGQNARLAARLTGIKIDIVPEEPENDFS